MPEKKASDEVALEASTAPPMVSQTQQSPGVPDLSTNLLVVACNTSTVVFYGAPTADNTVIAEMTARCTNDDNEHNHNARASIAHTRMVLVNDNNGKQKRPSSLPPLWYSTFYIRDL